MHVVSDTWTIMEGIFDLLTRMVSLGGVLVILHVVVALGILIYFFRHLRVLRQEILWDDIKRWGGSSLPALSIVLICLAISPIVLGEDPYMLWRYLVLRITAFSFGIVALSAGLLFVDSVTTGDWLSKVEGTEYGPVILLTAILLGVAVIIAWV